MQDNTFDMWPTESLLQTALWQTPHALPLKTGEVSYLRAESISKAYGECIGCPIVESPMTRVSGLTLQDVVALSPNLWNVHQDPIVCLDGSAVTLLTIQYNLCLGTISTYLPQRKDLLPLAQSLADYTTM